MKLRFLSAVACAALLTTAVYAQTAGGPPISYVKRVSNGDEIYLVNPNNTGLIRVYKAPSKVQVTMLDLRPGGGEIAFLEGFTKLKILAFDSYGRAEPGNPRTIRTVSSPCTVEAPDYHPTDGRLLFVEGCGRDRAVRTVQPGANSADAVPLFGNVAVFRARWSRLGDTIYYIGLRDGALSSDPTYLYRRSSTPSGDAEEIGVLNTWSTFDIAREGEKLFWNDGLTFKVLDLGVAGATTSNATTLECPRGMRMAFGPGDTHFVYTTESTKGGHFVIVGPSNCGSSNAVTGKGSWGWLDWRSQ